MNAREQVLGRIRAALADTPAAPAVPRHYRREGTADPAALVALLADRLVDYRATVRQVAAGELPSAVADLLDGTATLVVPADLPQAWLARWTGPVRHDPVPLADLDGPSVSVLTGCAAAVAETGTIVLDAGAAQGRRRLTLVPDHHVCVVETGQIVAGMPEALARLADPTRPLTFISGPSATSDIELNRVEGVHGPRRLDVILVSS